MAIERQTGKDLTKINEAIRAKTVRVIGPDGEKLGVMPIAQALQEAYKLNMDLVEINQDEQIPVCKILDYGKYKYSLKKKKQVAKKNQKLNSLKELYIHIGIGEHDYQVKLKQLVAFLKDDCKVKIGVKLRGREMVYSDKALELLARFYEDIGRDSFAKLDVAPKMEGNNAVVIFSPIGVTKVAAKSESEEDND